MSRERCREVFGERGFQPIGAARAIKPTEVGDVDNSPNPDETSMNKGRQRNPSLPAAGKGLGKGKKARHDEACP